MSEAPRRRCLLVGGSGFIGRHLGRHLGEIGYDVRSFDPHSAELKGDVTSFEQLNQAVSAFQPHASIYLAGIVNGTPDQVHAVNVTGIHNWLSTIAELPEPCHCVAFGSAAEYGVPSHLPVRECDQCNPINAYGKTKLEATQFALQASNGRHKINVVRPSSVVGAGMPVRNLLGALMNVLAQGLSTFEVNDLGFTRDYISVNDVSKGVIKVLESDLTGEIFNLGTERRVTVKEVHEVLKAVTNLPLELTERAPDRRTIEVREFVVSNEKIATVLGFHPTDTLEQMVREAWEAVQC